MLYTARIGDLLRRFFDSDVYYSFRGSRVTMLAAAVTAVIFAAAVFAPLLTPQNPFDPAAWDLMDAFKPPAWRRA